MAAHHCRVLLWRRFVDLPRTAIKRLVVASSKRPSTRNKAADDPARPKAASPASSGPAGTQFEASVGAHFLLAMLVEGDARGLAGARIDEVGLQRAQSGYPLDDVVVRGRLPSSAAQALQVQVKRSITFAPGDPVFADVAAQVARAVLDGALGDPANRFGVATARRSAKIDGPYQDLLTWVRQLTPAEFIARVNNPGESSDDARRFVATFRSHLDAAGAPTDDQTICDVLRRFQILPFDFGSQGSADRLLVIERAARALDPSSQENPEALWRELERIALEVAANGGGTVDRDSLGQQLTGGRFTLAGAPRFAEAGAALDEMASHALADIGDSVAGVRLSRKRVVEAVHAARDQGRYVEIRGGAGVGKSGVLRHFAEQAREAGRILFLAPGRTIGPGWTAFKASLGAPGTAREFLADLALQGGATLFIDSLDFFTESERKTVADLVREAAKIPAVSVMATARLDFATEESSWLPADALSALGPAPPIIVGELDGDDLDELRRGAPQLTTILSDNHPAKAVVRNLYRLSRLAAHPGAGHSFRSEIDMAEEWWRTGDGPPEGRRDRRRVLAALADAVLAGGASIDAAAHDAGAVDALIRSDTLRETATDLLSFRHDVLREWASAARLRELGHPLSLLPLDRPLTSAFARTMDLTARYSLERSDAGGDWTELLDRLSGQSVHISWRRPAILAIVRSEIGSLLLERSTAALLADGGALLGELIRTTLAADAQPARIAFAGSGFDPSVLPDGFFVPIGPQWTRLVHWALEHSAELPGRALEDVVNLFERFSMAMFGLDAFTPRIAALAFEWLLALEGSRYRVRSDPKPTIPAGLDWHQARRLESDLRRLFATFASRVPELARDYLTTLAAREHGVEEIKEILRYRGQLAQAAPAELAALTLKALVPDRTGGRRQSRRSEQEELIGYVDSAFLPASPAQGPFLELLTHAPEEGLRLVRALVDEVIRTRSRGLSPRDNGLVLDIEGEPRLFPWVQSYTLARPLSHPYSVASALMALEAWAHRRIENGEDVSAVLADVLGPPGAPAAVLLVAVDLILSHWPKTRDFSVPFAACAELLCIERQRLAHDQMPDIDLLGWGDFGPREPFGPVKLSDLTARPSRRISLENLLPAFAFGSKDESFDRLRQLQKRAVERLGAPAAGMNFADPAFMAMHAQNSTNRANYRKVEGGYEYIPPEPERTLVAGLAAAHAPKAAEFGLEAALSAALEDDSASSQELALQALAYGKQHTKSLGADDGGAEWMRGQAVLAAALVVARDAAFELAAEDEQWIRDVFAWALATGPDAVHRSRDGLRFNPPAIAAAGLVHLWRRFGRSEDRNRLLAIAGGMDPGVVRGFAAAFGVLGGMDKGMTLSLLRCGLAASVVPRLRFDESEEEQEVIAAEQRRRAGTAVAAEIAWLDEDEPQPAWPPLPAYRRILRRGISIGLGNCDRTEPADRLEEGWSVDEQAAGLWLRSIAARLAHQDPEAVSGLVRAYADWSADANGLGLPVNRELSSAPDDWNRGFYALLPALAGVLGRPGLATVLGQVAALPDRHFFELAAIIARNTDQAYFNGDRIAQQDAVWIRDMLAARLVASRAWIRESRELGISVEHHLAGAIAALMMNDQLFGSSPSCYLTPKGIERVDPFLPSMARLAAEGPPFYVAALTLNLLGVSPAVRHAPMLIAAARAWLEKSAAEPSFWVDHGLGRRIAALVESYLAEDRQLAGLSSDERLELSHAMALLVRYGVSEATAVEERLLGI